MQQLHGRQNRYRRGVFGVCRLLCRHVQRRWHLVMPKLFGGLHMHGWY